MASKLQSYRLVVSPQAGVHIVNRRRERVMTAAEK